MNKDDMVYQGYKLPLYPTKEQKDKLEVIFNAKIKIYNWAWEQQKRLLDNDEKVLSRIPLRNMYVKMAKESKDFSWMLGVVPDHISYYAIDDLNNQIKKVLTKKAKKVNFKSIKDKKKTFSQRNDIKLFRKDKVQISKIGLVKTNKHMLDRVPEIPNKKYLSGVRITKNHNEYYISFNVLIDKSKPVKTGEVIGIDLGITKLMVTSNGYEVNRPDDKVLKYEKKLRRLKRRAGKIYREGRRSKNLDKLEKEIVKISKKIENILRDNINKEISYILSSNPKAIVMEDLAVSHMLKNKYVSTQLMRAKFRYIRDQFQYRCERQGIDFMLADRWYPSSKICSRCKEHNHLGKGQRIYKCKHCGLEIDRDLNASINLKDLYFTK
nr:MAG TPA: endonuclease [Herelleviridae sp.]